MVPTDPVHVPVPVTSAATIRAARSIVSPFTRSVMRSRGASSTVCRAASLVPRR